MGTQSCIYPTSLLRALLSVAFLATALALVANAQTAQQALAVPLLLPSALAYDARGNLYFTETANHDVRCVDTSGVLTTVAGTGVQGFEGDGGAATSALLDSPAGLAITSSGTLYIADTHNHRIRRVDGVTRAITTYAGTGTASFSGDGSLATAATLNLPTALALDSSGNLFVADTQNHRIRRIDAVSGIITTVAGDGTQGFAGSSLDSPSGLAVSSSGDLFLADTHNHRILRLDHLTGSITTLAGNGLPGFSGDGASAAAATLALPHGLSVDAAGNLYLSDSSNHRIRRVDASTGLITTVAGDGTQGFTGDGTSALTASLDSPRAVGLSSGALVTLADSANQRVRQLDASGEIRTVAGLSTAASSVLTLSAPSGVVYGSGAVTASLADSTATGSITLFDTTVSLGTEPLTQGSASFSTNTLSATSHHLSASYTGDATHSATTSAPLVLTISPAPLRATPAAVSVSYGAPIPTLTGTLTGLLAQDSTAVTVAYSTSAAQLSPVGSYPITAALSGTSAGNYALTTAPASMTITQAPATVTISLGSATIAAGSQSTVSAKVVSSTSGVPTGAITLLDGGKAIATATLAGGSASFAPQTFVSGSHTLSASYAGDGNFLAASSAPVVETVGAAPASDFSLVSTGPSSVAVPAGNPASFAFSVATTGPALSSPILLSVSGLPPGATASFNPAYLPPGSFPASFQLTIQTVTLAMRYTIGGTIALALLLFVGPRRRRRAVLMGLVLTLTACGDRVNQGDATRAVKSYAMTVTGTATAPDGSTLVHTTTVMLNLQ
ncbi:hypothetical protein FTO74_08835 [Granulicella sp. WH15]|uniref:Ig-like domain repeat protein n=1 Tax=Granulicella sp. WH15 TaxID=2602070 RepID=UPI001367785A|nr:Ig-like domain repeat protein [Granulicella sp. WH15]QHN03461.1 hypothetical protein FTO74_08835 [Granulicella sp. WH15]